MRRCAEIARRQQAVRSGSMAEAKQRKKAFRATSEQRAMLARKMSTRNSCVAARVPIGDTPTQNVDRAFSRPNTLGRCKRGVLQSAEPPRGRRAATSANAPARDYARFRARVKLSAPRDRAGRSLACTEPVRLREDEIAAMTEASQSPGFARRNPAAGGAQNSQVCCERGALHRRATQNGAHASPCNSRWAARMEYLGREQVNVLGNLAAVLLQLKLVARSPRTPRTLAAVALRSQRFAALVRMRSRTKAAAPTAAAARRPGVRFVFRQPQSPRATTLVSSAQPGLRLRSRSTHRPIRAFLFGDSTRGSAAKARTIRRQVPNTSSRSRGTGRRVP